MSIAFMFLTIGDLKQEYYWKKLFENVPKNLYNIYVHNKEEVKSEWLQQYTLKDDEKIDTHWGSITLVKATLILIKKALENKDNQRFILLSDSCLPFHSFDYI